MSDWDYRRTVDLVNSFLENGEVTALSCIARPCQKGLFGGYEYLDTEYIIHLTNYRIILEPYLYESNWAEKLLIDFLNLAHYQKYSREKRKRAKATMESMRNTSITILYSQIDSIEYINGKENFIHIRMIGEIINREIGIFYSLGMSLFSVSLVPKGEEGLHWNKKGAQHQPSDTILDDSLHDLLASPTMNTSIFFVEMSNHLIAQSSSLKTEEYKKLEFIYKANLVRREDNFSDWKEGDKVRHRKHGQGVITKKFEAGDKVCFAVKFPDLGQKVIDPKLGDLEKEE